MVNLQLIGSSTGSGEAQPVPREQDGGVQLVGAPRGEVCSRLREGELREIGNRWLDHTRQPSKGRAGCEGRGFVTRWPDLCVSRWYGHHRPEKEIVMKYGVAWLLGIPPVLIAGWFLLNHC